MEDLTPMPVIKDDAQAQTMNFPDAIRKVIEGKRIARVSWGNPDYCLVKDGWLTIFVKGEFHTWVINDGDLESFDWVILPDSN